MDMDELTDEYQVKDLYLAAYLYSNNLKFIGLRKEADFFWFTFAGKEKAEILSAKFWRKEAPGNVKVYAEALRSLKDILFAGRR